MIFRNELTLEQYSVMSRRRHSNDARAIFRDECVEEGSSSLSACSVSVVVISGTSFAIVMLK